MALTLNNFWGAETGGLHEATASAGSPTASTTQKNSGEYSYRVLGGDRIDFSIFESVASASDNHIIGGWFYFDDATPVTESIFLECFATGAAQSIALVIATDGRVGIDPSGVATPTYSAGAVFTSATWHFVELYWQNLASGDAEVFIDGVSQASDTAKDYLTTTTVDTLRIGSNNSVADMYCDDIYYMSGATSAADRLGPVEVLAYRSSKNSVTADWIKGANGDLNNGTWLEAQDVPFVDSSGLPNAQYTDTTARAGGIDTDSIPFAGPLNSTDWGNVLETFYFDASDAGPTDPDVVWTNDANAFNGLTGSFASVNSSGSETLNELSGGGTTASASGDTISAVQFRLLATEGGIGTFSKIYEDGGSTALVTIEQNNGFYSWTDWAVSSNHTGGWTWAKLQALENICWQSGTGSASEVYKTEGRAFGEKTIGTIVGMKGIWRMKRTGGSGSTHFGLMGNTGSAIVDGDRTADFDPTTGYANYFDVREDNLPLSTEYGRIGFEKDGGGQDFDCADMLFQILHVPSSSTPVTVVVIGLGATGAVGSVTVLTPDVTVPVTGLQATAAVGVVTVEAAAIVAVTGVSATGNVGSVTVDAKANVAVTGLLATAAVGTVTVEGRANIPVTGLEATGAVGTAVVSIDKAVAVTGLEAIAAVGAVTVEAKANVAVTGLEATGSVGTVTVDVGGGPVTVIVTGVEATAAVGAPTVTADANVAVTGLEATGSVGSPTVNAKANVTVTGLSATGNVGSVTVIGACNVVVTGLAATGEVGTVTVVTVGAVVVEVTGLAVAGQVGAITVDARANVIVSGLEATGPPQAVVVTAEANVSVTGVAGTGQVGVVTVTVGGGVSVPVTGVEATGQVGSPTVIADANVAVTGVSATGAVGTVTVIAEQPVVVPVTGLSGTGSVGSVSVIGEALVSPTGIAAAGSVGTVTVITGVGVTVNVTGVAATGSVGTVTVVTEGSVVVPVTGLSATGSVGSVTVIGKALVSLTGIEATGEVGTVTVVIDAAVVVPVTGVSATGSVGSVTVVTEESVTVLVTGLEATGSVNNVTVTGEGVTTCVGSEGVGNVGTVTVIAAQTVVVGATGVAATGSVGSVSVSAQCNVAVTGVSATGGVGVAVVDSADTTAFPIGVAAVGEVGSVFVLAVHVPNQNPVYSEINPSDASGWVCIEPTQIPNYEKVDTE